MLNSCYYTRKNTELSCKKLEMTMAINEPNKLVLYEK